jgi:hypothetical protein
MYLFFCSRGEISNKLYVHSFGPQKHFGGRAEEAKTSTEAIPRVASNNSRGAAVFLPKNIVFFLLFLGKVETSLSWSADEEE